MPVCQRCAILRTVAQKLTFASCVIVTLLVDAPLVDLQAAQQPASQSQSSLKLCMVRKVFLSPAGDGLRPDMLVSVSAPKLGAKHFKGKHHYIGGRFIPPQIAVCTDSCVNCGDDMQIYG